MTLALAGDIGGTKTLLRLVKKEVDGSLSTLFERNYKSGLFQHLSIVVREFLASAIAALGYVPQPHRACFGIAGPVVNNTSELTNLRWSLDGDRMADDLGISEVVLINDFAAVGYGVLGLEPADVQTLQTGKAQERAPIGIIGAGTGLGEGFLAWSGQGYEIYASEGGHVDFAPRSSLEIELLNYLLARHERASVERVVSGLGIVTIYQFLRDCHGADFMPLTAGIAETVTAWEAGNMEADAAAAIAHAAIEGSDRLSEKAMQIFVEAYGAEAGNLALTLLPFGGLYIAGGIASKIMPLILQGNFLTALKRKGRVSPLLDNLPIHVVTNPNVGMIGAALYATRYANK